MSSKHSSLKINHYKTYPEYKDSGVELLGEFPKHWKTLANKHIFKLKKFRVGKCSSEYDLLSLTLRGVIKRDMENPEGKFPAEFDTYQEVKKGDFIFCLFDVEETPRGVGLSKHNGMITGAYTIMRPHEHFSKQFLYYFYLNIDSDKRLKPLYRGLRNTIPKESFASFKAFVPPHDEQIAIANFLDDKVSMIDEAITQKEQLIQLLNERKQIIIQNAVTKGLNPNAPMKDSGIEWIGKIPEHWNVIQLRRVVNKIDQGDSPSLSNDDTECYVLKLSAISKGKYFTHKEKTIAQKHYVEKFQLKKGDFLMTRGNTPDLVADTCIVTDRIDYKLMFSDLIYRLTFNHTIIPKFALHSCQSAYMRMIIKSYARGSNSTMSKVSQDSIKSFSILLPPKVEQFDIVAHVESQSTRIYKAIGQSEQCINKLKEYKSTLINSAVTGKIKIV